jgi:hypothetical protein
LAKATSPLAMSLFVRLSVPLASGKRQVMWGSGQ